MNKNNRSYIKNKRRQKFVNDKLQNKAKQMKRTAKPGKPKKKNIMFRKLS